MPAGRAVKTATRPNGAVLMTARFVVGHRAGRHVLIENGEVVFDDGAIVFVGRGYGGPVARRIDYGLALIGPGFVDLDALADLDTTILSYDNQPAWQKGRVWPRDYIDSGPAEMYSRTQLRFQKRHAFAELIRNGITTALPIASLFYRAWGETVEEFTDAPPRKPPPSGCGCIWVRPTAPATRWSTKTAPSAPTTRRRLAWKNSPEPSSSASEWRGRPAGWSAPCCRRTGSRPARPN